MPNLFRYILSNLSILTLKNNQMSQTKIRDIRLKNNFTREQIAEALHISQNAYCLIEKGITRLIDSDRINIIAQKLNVSPMELGLLDELNLNQNFYEKVENGYIHHIENLHAENKDLVQALTRVDNKE